MSKWQEDQRMNHTGDMTAVLTRSILDRYTIPDEPITALDRCDACGAQTLYRMHRPPSEEHPTRRGVLEFCGHHYRANLPELLGDGWAVATELEITA
jgi:hypothetical protein